MTGDCGAVAPMTASLIVPMVLFLPLLALPLMMKVKELEEQGRDIIT